MNNISPVELISNHSQEIVLNKPSDAVSNESRICPSKSAYRRFLNETPSASLSSFISYLELEKDADQKMLVTDDYFSSPCHRAGYFQDVAEQYSQAAIWAEEANDYPKAVALRIKQALVHAEKCGNYNVGIFLLENIIAAYQSHLLPAEITKLYDQIVALYDKQYDQIKMEAEQDSDLAKDYLAKNRIGKAEIFEILGNDTNQLYMEAADLLMQGNPNAYYSYEGFTNSVVAAMCYEKIPACAELAKSIYNRELEKERQYFDSRLCEIRKSFNFDNQDSYFQILDLIQSSHSGKFLSVKTDNQDAFFHFGSEAIECLELYIKHPQFMQKLQNLLRHNPNFSSFTSENTDSSAAREASSASGSLIPDWKHDIDFDISLLALHYIACDSLATHLKNHDHPMAEVIRSKIIDFEKLFPPDLEPALKNLYFLFQNDPELKEYAVGFYAFDLPFDGKPVNEQINLLTLPDAPPL